ncbi:MAG: hypothetical protein IPL32_10405 [Chloracidobacterium sp.]|nr:hypothetical protein [Chloracidobacterium sp.]
MPGSLPNPVFYFPAKVVVYSLAGWILNKIYHEGVNPLIFGIVRVVVGFGFGFLILVAITSTVPDSTSQGRSDFIWLILTRLIVWTGIIWVFYERKNLSLIRFLVVVILGTLLSFGFDAAFSWIDDEFANTLSIGMC